MSSKSEVKKAGEPAPSPSRPMSRKEADESAGEKNSGSSPSRKVDESLLGLFPIQEGVSNRRQSFDRRASDKIKKILENTVSAILSSDSIENALFNITDDIKDVLNCEAIRIFSLDRAKSQLYTVNFVSDKIEEIRWDVTKRNLPAHVIKLGESVLLENVNDEDELSGFPGLEYDFQWDRKLKIQTHSVMAIPVINANKRVGVLEAINKKDRGTFNQVDLRVGRAIADKLGNILEKLEQEEMEKKIHSLSVAIHRSSVMEEILFEIREPILDLFQAEFMSLYDIDPTKNEIYSKVKDSRSTVEIRVPISYESISGWVVKEKRLVNIRNVSDSQELKRYHLKLKFDKTWDQQTGFQTENILACPLIHEGRVLGEIQVVNKKNGEAFHEHDEKNIITISEFLAIAFYNHKKFASQKTSKFGYLVNNGLISMDELNDSIVKARNLGVGVEEILLDHLQLKRKDVGKSLANFYDVPYFGYDGSILLPKSCFSGLNKTFLLKNFWVPVEQDDRKVVILIDNPTHREKIKYIRQIFPKKEIGFRVGLKADIRDFLNSSTGESSAKTEMEEVSKLLDTLRHEKEEIDAVEEHVTEQQSAISESDSIIVRLVNKIIIEACEMGVSDIHIEPGAGRFNMQVRFRKDGECFLYEEIPYLYKLAVVSRIKIMARMDISEKRLPQDGKIKMKYGGKGIELRVAVGPTVGGNEDVVLRILASSKPIPLAQMNFSERNLDLLKKMVLKPYGLILVVGPTGSGKTTTLHSALSHINTPKRKIWTAEDPVEISQEGLRQMQINPKIGLNFARALRFFLRGDPDVIMVGEMRDVETCTISLEASLTGHLVLSTLHTNSAPETISRLLDMGMNPLNFADALLLVVAQRLVKTLCSHCKEDYQPSRKEFNLLVDEYGKEAFAGLGISFNRDLTLKKAVGCEKCNCTGYAGRTGLHEFLEGTKAVRNLILKRTPVKEIRGQAIRDGMTTLKQDGIWKVFKGQCDIQQVLAVCMD